MKWWNIIILKWIPLLRYRPHGTKLLDGTIIDTRSYYRKESAAVPLGNTKLYNIQCNHKYFLTQIFKEETL